MFWRLKNKRHICSICGKWYKVFEEPCTDIYWREAIPTFWKKLQDLYNLKMHSFIPKRSLICVKAAVKGLPSRLIWSNIFLFTQQRCLINAERDSPCFKSESTYLGSYWKEPVTCVCMRACKKKSVCSVCSRGFCQKSQSLRC